MEEHPISHYAGIVRAELSPEAFEAQPRRLGWLALSIAMVALGLTGLTRRWGGGWGAAGFCLMVAQAFSCMGFVGHEMLHGAIVRHGKLRHLLGGISLVPFTLSPTLWVAWHNRRHHGRTAVSGVDPDAFPSEADFAKSSRLQLANHFHWGRRRPLGFVMLAIGFTGQMVSVLISGVASGILTERDGRKAWTETLVGVAFWVALGVLLGPRVFVLGYVVPLVLANIVAIGYIVTNHSLNPQTETNDPLLNSLSVTVPGLLNAVHLGFGFHVEHHLFPSMSSRHAGQVRDILLKKWPDRYQSLPLLEAHRRLLRTPRVYGTPTLLRDPDTREEFEALLPHARMAPQPS